jgi:DNA-binding transcriptional MerR regulator
MEMRVEQLSARSGVAVDTIRYYQSKGLLEPPRRQGRVAWYDDGHLERLGRIRALQQRGFTLATIVRLVDGDLDAADEALIGELSGMQRPRGGPDTAESEEPGNHDPVFTIAELATETGVPLALLKAVEAEGLLIPRRVGGEERYTVEDVAASRAGLLLLEWGIPLSALLEVARRHHEATQVVAGDAVALFSTHVRGQLRQGLQPRSGDHPPVGETAPAAAPDIDQLLRAYDELLPAVTALVGHHFTRALMKAALDHVEQVASDEERRAIWDQIGTDADLADLAAADRVDLAAADRVDLAAADRVDLAAADRVDLADTDRVDLAAGGALPTPTSRP